MEPSVEDETTYHIMSTYQSGGLKDVFDLMWKKEG